MLSLRVLSLLLSASSTFASIVVFPRAPTACKADNCLRAITGTAPGQKTTIDRLGDCSSFMVKTVTPETVTITSTTTLTTSTTASFATTTTTTTTAGAGVNAKRSAVTVSPSNVPTYVSACSGTVRYSSACSCAGVTGSTITVDAPTITNWVSATATASFAITATSTATAIVQPPPSNDCDGFRSPCVAGAKSFNEYPNNYLNGGQVLQNIYTITNMPDCVALCANTANCVAVTFLPNPNTNTCQLFNGNYAITVGSGASNMYAAILTTSDTACDGTRSPCVAGGKSFYEFPNTYLNGGQVLQNFYTVATFPGCITLCANTANCVAITFLPNPNTNTCQLLNGNYAISVGGEANNVFAAILTTSLS